VLDPTSATAWSNRGYALFFLRRKREALAAFDQALSMDATLASAWNGKGNILRDEKRFAEALDAYDRAHCPRSPAGALKP
jgi:tetratricopeptide (TPR) repeat protein